jgi:hypothetical protein
MPDEAKPDEEKQDPEETDEAAPKGPFQGRPPNILTRPTDHAARPGFRSPANQKSKAQKKNKAGGKKPR